MSTRGQAPALRLRFRWHKVHSDLRATFANASRFCLLATDTPGQLDLALVWKWSDFPWSGYCERDHHFGLSDWSVATVKNQNICEVCGSRPEEETPGDCSYVTGNFWVAKTRRVTQAWIDKVNADPDRYELPDEGEWSYELVSARTMKDAQIGVERLIPDRPLTFTFDSPVEIGEIEFSDWRRDPWDSEQWWGLTLDREYNAESSGMDPGESGYGEVVECLVRGWHATGCHCPPIMRNNPCETEVYPDVDGFPDDAPEYAVRYLSEQVPA
jgi:hypothetical protein